MRHILDESDGIRRGLAYYNTKIWRVTCRECSIVCLSMRHERATNMGFRILAE